MLRTTSDYFRQFTCFSAFLIFNGSLLELRGQDQAAGVTASAASGPIRAGARKTSGRVTPVSTAGSTFRQRAVPPNVPATALAAAPQPSAATSPIQKLQQLFPGMALPGAAGVQAGAALKQAGVEFSPAGLPLHLNKPYSSMTPFAKGARPSGKSVAPTYNQTPHSVDNPADPYIVQQAQALNNDPNKIFAFVRDQIGFLVYPGSLQGARGTLWTGAGNSLDKSSLLVALLGAAGVQNLMYVQGTLQQSQQQKLILSMFTPPSGVGGCPPPGTQLADPANDPTLLQDLSEHWWVKVNGVMEDASFAGSQPGQTFGVQSTQIALVPYRERYTVTFRLDVEQYAQALALFGSGFTTTEVVNQAYDTAYLVGNPVTVGNFVSGSGGGALVISDTTFSYSPYLRIGQTPGSPSTDLVIPGQTYQETYTNFPLGSQILTGEFFYMDVTDSLQNVQTYERDMLDRIGFAARQGGADVSLTPPSPPAPALLEQDLITVNSAPSQLAPALLTAFETASSNESTIQQALQSQLAGVNLANPTPPQQLLIQQAQNASLDGLTILGKVATTLNIIQSDGALGVVEPEYVVRAWYNSPRLTLFASSTIQASASLSLALDLRKDDILAVAAPGQVPGSTFLFNMGRGIVENLTERMIGGDLRGALSGGAAAVASTTLDVFNAAVQQNISTLYLSPSDATQVPASGLTADARARILAALSSGLDVVMPAAQVLWNGAATTAWYEVDPATGYTVGVTADGGHQSLVENAVFAAFVGIAAGTLTGTYFIRLVGLPPGYSPSWQGNILLPIVVTVVGGIITGATPLAVAIVLSFALTIELLLVLSYLASKLPKPSRSATWNRSQSRSSNPILKTGAAPASPTPPFPAFPIAMAEGPLSTITGSPLGAAVVPDPTFLLNSQGAQLPTVFQVQIGNGEATADTFSLGQITPPPGFTVAQSLPSVTIPAGTTGAIGVCLLPAGSLPPAGSQVPLSATVTSTTNPSLNATAGTTFTMPSIQAVTLTPLPSTASGVPGASIPVTLQIQSTGNVPATVALTATTDAGLTLSGLPPQLTLNAGQTSTANLTLTPGAAAALGSTLNATITATFGGSTVTATIPVNVHALQAVPASNAAAAAASAGRTDVATTMSQLSGAISGLVGGCTPATLAAVQNYTSNLLQEMFATAGAHVYFFSPIFDSGLYSAFAEIANATCSTYPQALTDLVTTTTAIANLFNSPAAYPFVLGLEPSSLVAQPNTSNTVKIQLQNQAQVPETYTLSLAGIPNGVNGSLNTTSITLSPGQSVPLGNSNDPAVTISETGGTLQAFSYTVLATPGSFPSAAQSVTGTMALRPDVLDVQDVTPQPGFVNAGSSVDIVTHIVNTVNQQTPILAKLQVLNASAAVIASAGPQSATLSVSTLLTAIDFGQVTIPSGTPNGNYKLSVTVTDTNGNPLTGGSGTGDLLVGSPVTATLTATPQTVPAGSSTVQNTLTVFPTAANPSPLKLLGTVGTASAAETIALNGNTAYVCDQNEVSVVNVSNPTAPAVLTTVLSTYIQNAGSIHCDVQGGDLLVFADTGSTTTGNNPGFLVFGLSNPQSPNLISAVPFDKRFVGDPILYSNNLAFLYTNVVFSLGSFVTGQGGDIVAVDMSNVSAPTILSTLSQNGDPVYGGPNEFFGQALYSPSILFGVGTNLTGTSTSGGSGVLDVIDISNPSAISIANQVTVSGVEHIGLTLGGGGAVLTQGNLLVATGDSGATPDNSSVLVFDISDPQNPVLLSNTATGTFCCQGRGQAILGPNQFLFAGTQDASGSPLLLLVNTVNPLQPVITPLSVAVAPNNLVIQGNYLYAANGASGLGIYSVPGNQLDSSITSYTAIVQTANNATAAYNPSSFNVTPSKITPGSGFDTIEWDSPSVSTLTWNTNVTGLEPAQLTTVDQGGTLSFVSALGNGVVTLPAVTVDAEDILSLTPASQNLAAPYYYGAAYTLTVRNPTSATVTYTLSVAGIPGSWLLNDHRAALPVTVAVPAQGAVSLPFGIGPDTTVSSGTYTFQAVANAPGLYGAVQGSLIFTNTPSAAPPGPGSPAPVTNANVVIQITPGSGTAGPATSALYRVAITNVGPVADIFQLRMSSNVFPGTLPYQFDNYSPTIPPGTTFTAYLSVTPPAGTTPQSFPFTVYAYGQNKGGIGSGQATLNIVANALTLALNPVAAAPNSTMALTVTNTGILADTFQLSLAGPGALAATLPSSSVALAAGASQTLNIAIGAPNFATLGSIPFQVLGASQDNPAVTALANGSIAVPSSLGVTAAFVPASQSPPASAGAGPAVFALNVQNAGTVQDFYAATITGTTGGVQASLVGLNGSAAQNIPLFVLPGAAAGELFVNLTPLGTQSGTATVKIVSLTNSAITASATATLTAGTVVGSPCDVNNDSVTNVSDAQQEINEALGKSTPANDLNGDGVVNVVDVQIDINAILKLGCEAGTQGVGGSAVHTAPVAQLAAPHGPGGGGRSGGPARIVVVDLGTLGGATASAYAIDNLGDVVGASDTAQPQAGGGCGRSECPVRHAFLWTAGRMTDLGLLLDPSAQESAAYGINDMRQAVGTYLLPGPRTASFLYTADAAAGFANLMDGKARAINRAGQVAGYFATGSGAHPFLWNAGTLVDLGTLGGAGAQASAVNDQGQVVGFANLSGNSAAHAFLYTGSSITDLGTLGGTDSSALGINQAGEIVGVSQVAGDASRHAFVYSAGWMSDLGTLGGPDCQADGINSRGQIVGWAETSAGQRHAVLWHAGKIVDLNELAAIGLDAVLEEATAINDFGQIAANGSNGRGYLIVLPEEFRH